eukprot:570138-Rhodomonas_salina.1
MECNRSWHRFSILMNSGTRAIRCVSTEHRIARPSQYAICQYRTLHSTSVAVYAISVPDIA